MKYTNRLCISFSSPNPRLWLKSNEFLGSGGLVLVLNTSSKLELLKDDVKEPNLNWSSWLLKLILSWDSDSSLLFMGSNFPPSIASSIPSWNVTHLGLSASLLAIFQCCKRKKKNIYRMSQQKLFLLIWKIYPFANVKFFGHLQTWKYFPFQKCYEARAEICQKFGWLFGRFETTKISFRD